MVDAPALGAGPFGGGGSSPLFRTNNMALFWAFVICAESRTTACLAREDLKSFVMFVSEAEQTTKVY